MKGTCIHPWNSVISCKICTPRGIRGADHWDQKGKTAQHHDPTWSSWTRTVRNCFLSLNSRIALACQDRRRLNVLIEPRAMHSLPRSRMGMTRTNMVHICLLTPSDLSWNPALINWVEGVRPSFQGPLLQAFVQQCCSRNLADHSYLADSYASERCLSGRGNSDARLEDQIYWFSWRVCTCTHAFFFVLVTGLFRKFWCWSAEWCRFLMDATMAVYELISTCVIFWSFYMTSLHVHTHTRFIT